MATYRARLIELARSNHGVVTTTMAVAAGVPTFALRAVATLDRKIDYVFKINRDLKDIYWFWHDGIDEHPEGADHALREYATAIALAGAEPYIWGENVSPLGTKTRPTERRWHDEQASIGQRRRIRRVLVRRNRRI